MLEPLRIGVIVVEFVYNCFKLLINVNNCELPKCSGYIHVFIRSMTMKSCKKKELLQIYSLRYNSINY